MSGTYETQEQIVHTCSESVVSHVSHGENYLLLFEYHCHWAAIDGKASKHQAVELNLTNV